MPDGAKPKPTTPKPNVTPGAWPNHPETPDSWRIEMPPTPTYRQQVVMACAASMARDYLPDAIVRFADLLIAEEAKGAQP